MGCGDSAAGIFEDSVIVFILVSRLSLDIEEYEFQILVTYDLWNEFSLDFRFTSGSFLNLSKFHFC